MLANIDRVAFDTQWFINWEWNMKRSKVAGIALVLAVGVAALAPALPAAAVTSVVWNKTCTSPKTVWMKSTTNGTTYHIHRQNNNQIGAIAFWLGSAIEVKYSSKSWFWESGSYIDAYYIDGPFGNSSYNYLYCEL
jgi:hypothetical protein